jgi:hypothetical protein
MAWKQKGLCLLLIFLALPTGIYPFALPRLPLLRGVGHVARESFAPEAHKSFLDLSTGRRKGTALTQINTFTALHLAEGDKMVSHLPGSLLYAGFFPFAWGFSAILHAQFLQVSLLHKSTCCRVRGKTNMQRFGSRESECPARLTHVEDFFDAARS